MTTMITWTKPDGLRIQTNDHEANIATALQLGWKRYDENEAEVPEVPVVPVVPAAPTVPNSQSKPKKRGRTKKAKK